MNAISGTWLTGVILLASTGCLHGQQVLYGIVTDAATGEPIGQVLVSAGDSTRPAWSLSDGHFALVLPPGTRTVRWSRLGYRALSIDVTMRDSVRMDVQLSQSAILIGEQLITARRPPNLTIHGLGAISVSPAEAKDLGGSYADVLRSLQTITGVTANNETSSRFYVRGGASDENLLALQGVEVLEPFHLKESPITSLSAINVDALKSVLFIPGGFPARYGDRLSSVVDMEYREGNRERPAGSAEMSLLSLGLTAESPLGTAATGIVCARTSYSRYVDEYFADGLPHHPSFFDIQGVLAADPAPEIHCATAFLVSRDRTSGVEEGGYGSTLLTVRGDMTISGHQVLHATFGWYDETQHLAWSGGSPVLAGGFIRNDERQSVLSGDIRLETEVTPWYSLTAGLASRTCTDDITRTQTGTSAGGSLPVTSRLGVNPFLGSLYAENVVTIGARLLVNAGVRADMSTVPEEFRVSPRFLAAYRFGGGTTLKAAVGMYRQTANGEQLLAAAQAGVPAQHMQRAVHYIVGLEQPLKRDLAVRVDIYHKDLAELISYERLNDGEIVHSPRNDSRGVIDGVDLEASFSDERVFGWMSAAFLVAKENNQYDNLGWRFRPNDQAKTVTVVFEYRINERLTVNIRGLYGSGFAYGADTPGVSSTILDARQHYPNYTRADVRIQYLREIAGVQGMVYVEIVNIFSHRNVLSFSGPALPGTQVGFNRLLPTLVDVGIRFWF